MIQACPLCGAPASMPFLCRPDVPIHQNLTAASPELARAMPRGRLEPVCCAACGFVFNRAFDPKLTLYGPGYDNTQSLSPTFAAHLHERLRHMVERRRVRGARVVEIGCGRGDFLRALVAWPGAGNRGVGCDPACADAAEELGGALRFVRGAFTPDCGPADAVICRHVIEHLPDPLALLRQIRAALPTARVFFETPDVAWSLRHGVVWDFFYEHCSLFTAETLAAAFARAGYGVTAIERVFDGQYLWLEADPLAPAAGQTGAPHIAGLATAFAATEAGRVAAWQERLHALAPVALWGAGAKGATVAALADPAATRIACLVDINPAKQGRFLPGTGHPVVAAGALAAHGVHHVLPMNPAYRAEIAASLPPGLRLAEWPG